MLLFIWLRINKEENELSSGCYERERQSGIGYGEEEDVIDSQFEEQLDSTSGLIGSEASSGSAAPQSDEGDVAAQFPQEISLTCRVLSLPLFITYCSRVRLHKCLCSSISLG